MLQIAICDDQPEHIKTVQSAAEAYFSARSNLAVQILAFDNPLTFLEQLDKSGGYDIVLLDICMPGISGAEVAREIRARRDNTEIIFITASDEFAVDAFALKAAHYVLKPFTGEQFNAAMDRAMERFSSKPPQKLMLHGESGALQAIDADSILYVESVGQVRLVHTTTGVLSERRLSLASLLEEFEKLAPGQFIAPYRGYIVNQQAIRTIAANHIALQNGETIPIKSRDFRRIRDAFFEWSFGKRGKKWN